MPVEENMHKNRAKHKELCYPSHTDDMAVFLIVPQFCISVVMVTVLESFAGITSWSQQQLHYAVK